MSANLSDFGCDLGKLISGGAIALEAQETFRFPRSPILNS